MKACTFFVPLIYKRAKTKQLLVAGILGKVSRAICT